MTANLIWLIALGPLALGVTGLLVGHRKISAQAAVGWAIRFAGLVITVAFAVAFAVLLILGGPLRTETIGWRGAGFALFLDSLSTIMFLLVGFIGLIVLRYSRNYLDGDPGQGPFIRWLCFTLAAVLFVIVSGNLFQFFLAWVATSLSLHRLLLFYPERPNAVLAARKKFVASRFGDACLFAAMILIYRVFGSLDYAALFSGAAALRAAGAVPVALHAAAVFLVAAALLKSAQFPFHGWLTEVMETPTPVSALLHAGVINAGGFLVLRFAGLISLSVPSLDVMVLVGGATALFGSVVMLTQTSVKVSLAYSTIAQMGFMMLECGLGAFSAALLHIVAHALYKAHAFLSSGSVIDLARASWSPSPGGRPHTARTAVAVVAVLAMMTAIGALFGASVIRQPGVFALAAVLLLGLTHLMTQALDERPSLYVLSRVLMFAALVAATYFGLQGVMEQLTATSLPAVEPLRGPFDLAIIALAVLSFAAVTVLQSMLPGRSGNTRWLALYMHISNGLYVNTLANRLALRFWPNPPPRPSASAYGLELAKEPRA
ncbi:MAG: NADH-quinone oxidoreductase subunit L [Acidobacteriia bacterium]|nr:NADH-quinone oxidoreductase subunit L [Methyloceanibacter sp.]MCL6492846.1 NADH-quinone oxidoreductase subunit L [Terriglobia bacterium]